MTSLGFSIEEAQAEIVVRLNSNGTIRITKDRRGGLKAKVKKSKAGKFLILTRSEGR